MNLYQHVDTNESTFLGIARDRCYADNLENVFRHISRAQPCSAYIFESSVQFISRDHIDNVDFNDVSVYMEIN